MTQPIDEKRDLVLSKDLAATPAQIWAAWSSPELLATWWAPVPFKTEVQKMELVTGGAFDTAMSGPNGEHFAGRGLFLEVVPQQRIVFTDTLEEGYRPGKEPFMTAIITLEPLETGTRYTALVRHKDEETCKKHEEMGFFPGWGTVMDQLEQVAQGL